MPEIWSRFMLPEFGNTYTNQWPDLISLFQEFRSLETLLHPWYKYCLHSRNTFPVALYIRILKKLEFIFVLTTKNDYILSSCSKNSTVMIGSPGTTPNIWVFSSLVFPVMSNIAISKFFYITLRGMDKLSLLRSKHFLFTGSCDCYQPQDIFKVLLYLRAV